jgi:hypothetical protein
MLHPHLNLRAAGALHESRNSFLGVCNNRLTLKALANVSPGFALKPWVQT